MAAKTKDPLFIYSNGRVASINKLTGEIIWEVRLKQYMGSKGMGIGTLKQEGDKLFIGSGGYLICISAKDGAFIWKNELKGWGYGFISMGESSISAAAMQAQQQSEAAAMSAAT